MFNIGDKITPVKNCFDLTIGKIYVVQDPKELDRLYPMYSPLTNLNVAVINDNGDLKGYWANRFELV